MEKKIAEGLSKIWFSSIIIALLVLQTRYSCFAQSKAEVQIKNSVPSLFIDGKTYPPFAYMSYLGEKIFYTEIADAGIHLYNIPSYLGDRGINSISGIGNFRPPIWIEENQFDFTALSKDFEAIINSDSQAKIIVRIYLDPPLWWEKRNPDACCVLPDGTTFRQCFASEKWREETAKAFQHLIEWILKSPYTNHLVGIHVAAGSTEEWFYHAGQYHDENPARTKAFQEWLKNKYKNTNALQKAWNNQLVTFETAQIANISESEERLEWRNSDTEKNYIDSYRFHSEVMVDNIAFFCKIVKEISHGDLLTGAFYGYHYYLADPMSGHGALSKLLECPDLDYLSSPNDYNRVIGEDWPPMAAVQSVQLHGKLWLAENDTRTSKTTLLKDRSKGIAPPGQYESSIWLGPADLETSVSFLWKNAGRMLAYGYGGWWFDMWGGWFSNPELLNVLAKTQQFYSEYIPNKAEKMQSQVCVIVDEELPFWDASHGKLSSQIMKNRYPLAKTGTSYNLFLRTDLEAISTNQYQVIWLMGIFGLNEKEKLKIDKWRQKGITVLWTNEDGTKIYANNEKEIFINGKLLWTDSELRKLWKSAGVHLYIDTDDVFYVGRNWMCIHSSSGGDKTISFPFFTQVYDPISQKVVADSTKTIEVNLVPKSTKLFRINPF